MRASNLIVSQPCLCAHSTRATHAVARSEPSDKQVQKDLPDEINEDVLAKLRAFEEENKKLKDQLTGSVCCLS